MAAEIKEETCIPNSNKHIKNKMQLFCFVANVEATFDVPFVNNDDDENDDDVDADR